MAFDYSVPDKIASRAKDNTITKESLESVGSQIEFNKGYEWAKYQKKLITKFYSQDIR